eukprot:EG_transcript_22601
MGVKGLMGFFSSVDWGPPATTYTVLYIDVMCLLHGALTPAFCRSANPEVSNAPAEPKAKSRPYANRGKAKATPPRPASLPSAAAALPAAAVEEYVRLVLCFLNSIVNHASPSTHLFVAFDGASMAKVPEKFRRRQRYKGAERAWRVALTPGTPLLDTLAEAVAAWAERYGAERSVACTVSGPWQPEEADLKLLRHAVGFAAAHPGADMAVVSTDSDVFLLGLASLLPRLHFLFAEVKPSTATVRLRALSIDALVRTAVLPLQTAADPTATAEGAA